MSVVAKVRDVLAVLGIAALALSAALVLGSFARPVISDNYFKQADEARPWVQWGSLASLAAFALSFFHYGALRIVTVSLGFVLMLWWFGAAASLL